MISRRGAALLALLLASSGCAPVPRRAGSQTTRPARGTGAPPATLLASFERAWQRIADTYPYPDFHGLDWQAVREELRPRAARARSASEERAVIREMIERLHESHFEVVPGLGLRDKSLPADDDASAGAAVAPDGGPPGDAGFDMRPVGGHFVVTRVDEGGAAQAAGVKLGWELVSMGDLDEGAVAALEKSLKGPDQSAGFVQSGLSVERELQGSAGSTLEASFRDGHDALVRADIVLGAAHGEMSQLGNLPPLLVDVEHRIVPGPVGYVRFNLFLTPVSARFDAALRTFRDAKVEGVVLDLRGNPGGIGGMVMGLAGHFVSRPVTLGTMTTRQGVLNFRVNPRVGSQVIDAPLAVLVDGLSVSTAELFAAGLQGIGRARVFGRRSAGMALPSIIETLPDGDRLQFAIADLHGPKGERIEGAGVQPDEVIALSREDLLAGRDPDLDAALHWIRSQPDITADHTRTTP